ncbi:MAG: LPS assembly lipoprotein LptE [Endomicrobium sp.]|jgi:hypothetical protein|nr:LPS assembly lipoprotein LptE [Endomicrobium sp.]
MRKFTITFLIVLTLFSSCSSVVKVLPEHVKKVYVGSFNNYTYEVGLEVEFTNTVIEEMLKDGRIYPVNTKEESDGILIAKIKRYIYFPLFTFSDTESNQCGIIIEASVHLIDKNGSKVLWTEPNMKGMQVVYCVTNLKSAKSNIWERFSRDIIRRTVKVLNN